MILLLLRPPAHAAHARKTDEEDPAEPPTGHIHHLATEAEETQNLLFYYYSITFIKGPFQIS